MLQTIRNRFTELARKTETWICLGLTAMVFAVFGQTLTHDFINFDDGQYVYENGMVRQGLTLKGLKWAVIKSYSSNWHPLTWLSHMLDCQIYDLDPSGHHLTNVMIHAAVVVMLFLVLRNLTSRLWESAFVAAVFAIHPLRVESVAWVSERKDVLSGLFFVLTIGAYARYARQVGTLDASGAATRGVRDAPIWRYLFVLVLFALGLMCKPMLVTLPIVLFLLDYWPLQRRESIIKLIAEKLPLLALSVGSSVATVWAQTGVIQSLQFIPLHLRLANAAVSCAVYLGQLFWPAGLAVYYPFPRDGVPAWQWIIAVFILTAISIYVFRKRKDQPWLAFGWLWYLIMLVPVIGIVQVGGQARADRYTYLPEIGVCVALTWFGSGCLLRWNVPAKAVAVGAGILILACSVSAVVQTTYWQNSVVLWDRTITCTSKNAMAYSCLGEFYRQRGNLDEAMEDFRQALKFRPDNGLALNGLASALMETGRVAESLPYFRRAVEANPFEASFHVNFGTALLKNKMIDESLSQYDAALKISPNFGLAHYDMAVALEQAGKKAEAIQHYRRVVEINPANYQAQHNLELLLAGSGGK